MNSKWMQNLGQLDRTRMILLGIILLSIPCYCLGGLILWGTASAESKRTSTPTQTATELGTGMVTPSYTLPAGTLTPTPTGTITPTFTATITYVIPPSLTPSQTATLQPTETFTLEPSPTSTPQPTETATIETLTPSTVPTG